MTTLELQTMAIRVREDILTCVHSAGSGHLGGSLSAADIFTCLYFDVLNIDPENPQLRLGIQDEFGQSGPGAALLEHYGLDAGGIYRQVSGFLKK